MEENLGQKNLEKKVDDILEIVQFIKDNSASKQDLNDLRGEFSGLRGEFSELRIEMREGFESVRAELASINLELEEIKRDLKKLENRTQVDDDAMISDNLELKARVEKLEKQVQQLQLAHN